MRHLVNTVIYILVLCRLSATQETTKQYHIIDDSEDFNPYDGHSYHPILQAHLEGPEDNLQSSLSVSEPQEESAQRETGATIGPIIETANDQEEQLETPTVEIKSTVEPVPSEASETISEPDQQIDPKSSRSTLPENVKEGAAPEQIYLKETTPEQQPPEQPNPEQQPPEQPTPEQQPPQQPTPEQQPPEQPTPGETPLEQSSLGQTLIEQTPTEQTSTGQQSPEQSSTEKTLLEQPSTQQTPGPRGEIVEESTLKMKVSELEERIERQVTTDQPMSNNDIEPTPIRSNVERPSQIVASERADEHQSSPDAPTPTTDEHQLPQDDYDAAVSHDKPPPRPESTASEIPEIKSARPSLIKPGRIPMKESSHQYSPETSDASGKLKPKSSLYEDGDDDDQLSMFPDVTPKMAIFSGLTIMSLIGGMIYQLMLKDGNKPLVQSSNHTNVTKSTNLLPTPAQNLKDKEIMMLEKKIKLLEQKLQLAPLQATLRELKSKNIDSRLSESKSFLKQIRQYQCKLDENRKLKSEVVADRYERLLQIRNLQDINKIPGVIRYIEYHKRVENREMNICEMQAEDEFLREQIDLFRELVSEFEREYSSLNEEINRVKDEGLNLERERSNIAVN